MSDFIAFARAHGILIDRLPPLGVWRRYPTDDHPHKRNGAIKWMGEVGFIQNWAISSEVAVWKTDKANPVDLARYRRDVQEAERKRLQQQEEAAKKAQWILSQCQYGHHPYLAAKGFPDLQGDIWKTDGALVLVIPMYVGSRLVGCQLIDEAGQKKFLRGQITSGAEHVFGEAAADLHILCEGYATGWTAKLIFSRFSRCKVHVCFSAGNLRRIAEKLPGGIIVADNDQSGVGERSAKEIGWPYYLPPTVGDDLNDHFLKRGEPKAGLDVKSVYLKWKRDEAQKRYGK